MLRVSGLNVSIGAVTVLREVNLELPNGVMAGLIGRNGAGKTSLMRGIMGLLPPRSGRVEFGGVELTKVPPHARTRAGIGYMPEDRRLVPALTTEENILLPVWALNGHGAVDRLEKIYGHIPELKTMAGRKALQLSGGQQKLVALGRALMCGTKLLLLDEPFEGVAPVLAQRISEVISGLRKEGLSILISESDLQHSARMLDRVFRIERGQVTQEPHPAPASAQGESS